MRKVWRTYFPKIDAIIYIIDSADSARFEESRAELFKIINSKEIGDIPILIYGNKIDKPEACSEDELRLAF